MPSISKRSAGKRPAAETPGQTRELEEQLDQMKKVRAPGVHPPSHQAEMHAHALNTYPLLGAELRPFTICALGSVRCLCAPMTMGL
jgi:hypothetical protein